MTTKEFNSLSKAEKRVEIAKDVLRNIKSGKYHIDTELYIQVNNILEGSIKKQFSKIKNCTVCALGACLLSITKYKNKLNFEDVDNINSFKTHRINPKIKELFGELFSPKQLLLIESAFEGYVPGSNRIAEVFDKKNRFNLLRTTKDFRFQK